MPKPILRFPCYTSEIQKSELNQYLYENKDRNKDNKFTKEDVLSVSGEFGIVNQIAFQGRSYAGESVAPYHIVETGDVVYTKSPLKASPYGIIKYKSGVAGIVSTLYAVYHCKDNVSGKFVEYYFGHMQRLNKYLKPLVNIGAKHDMKVNNEKVLSGEVYFPSIAEQKKIVTFLETIDSRIENQNQLLLFLNAQKLGVIQKLFSKSVRFQESGNPYPEWKKCTLGDIGVFYNGLSGKTKDDFDHGTSKYITYMNVNRNTFAQNDILEAVDVSPNESQNMVEYGDILFTQSSENYAEAGITSVYLYHDKPYLNSFCMGFRLNNLAEINPIFMGYLMRTDYVRKQIMKEAQGISRINLASSRILGTELYIPSIKEQEKIAACITAFDKKIACETDIYEALKDMRCAFLQQLFI